MKTLVFCTSYASDARTWEDRHGLWVTALQRSRLRFDQLLIVDDASPTRPAWNHLAVIEEKDGVAPEHVRSDAPIVLYTHAKRLGRQSVFEFPGWYRSFAFGVLYGAGNGFEKIIHIESDAFLVSAKLQHHLDEFRHGWFSCWCQAYQFPEIAIQAAAGNEIAAMADFVRAPYAQMAGQVHELTFPFTHIERAFVGNRYGEMFGHVPAQADFSTQTLTGQPESYYWWLAPGRESRGDDDRASLMYVGAPFRADVLEGGWSGAEAGFSWMTDFESSLFLPPMDAAEETELELSLFPCVFQHRTSQTLIVLMNERLLGNFTVYRQTTLRCRVPSGVVQSSNLNKLQFLHPDAFAPSTIGPHAETRKLSVALSSVELFARSAPPRR